MQRPISHPAQKTPMLGLDNFRSLTLLITGILIFNGGKPCAAIEPESRVEQFPVHLTDNQVTQATLKLPRKLDRDGKIPVLLIFGGFENAAKVLDLVHTRKPVALASFDYPFSTDRHLSFPRDLKALPEAKRLFPSTIQGITELISILKKRPDIDSNRIIAIGASFGAPFVLAAAAQIPEISQIVLVHPFGQVPEVAEHVILRSWLPRYGWMARPLAWLISRLAWIYIDVKPPEEYARLLHENQRVLMIVASNDSFIPRDASDSLWLALQQSPANVTRRTMPTDHLLPGSVDLIDQIIQNVEGWIVE